MIRYNPQINQLLASVGRIEDENIKNVLKGIFENLNLVSQSLNSVENQETMTIPFKQIVTQLARNNSNNRGAEFIKPWFIKDSQLVNEVIETKAVTVNASGSLFIDENGTIIIEGV